MSGSPGQSAEQAKEYSRRKYSAIIIETIFSISLFVGFLGSGFSRSLADHISSIAPQQYLLVPLFLFVTFLAYYALIFPFTFYQSYILEHKFSLSRQNIRAWVSDQFKSGVISYCIGLILVAAFYMILKLTPGMWWLAISVFWIFFSLILAKLLPVIIIPLFFKYKKLSDEILRQRIITLAAKMRVKILDVFEIDFSKKTVKANAAFVGIGSTRRVLLADTLRNNYTHDEIEVILAHEFAHYRLRHLLKLLFINAALTIVIFYVIFRTNSVCLGFFKLASLSDIAALPLVFLYFIVFGIIMQPLEAGISRVFERNADTMALKVTGSKDAFISMMDKLASQNLADRSPHPIIKFFFFDHPPIAERIRMAESFKP